MNELFNKNNITGLILAGGAGSRVGGVDKGFLKYAGSTMIEHQIKWIEPQVNRLIISANRNISEYKKFGHLVLQDSKDGFEGPLYGLLSALENCATDWLFVQPIDVPQLPDDLLALFCKKITQLNKNEIEDCFYLTSDQREHYLSMLINRKCLQALQRYLNANKQRVRDFHRQIGSVAVDLSLNELSFKNMNFQSDYQ